MELSGTPGISVYTTHFSSSISSGSSSSEVYRVSDRFDCVELAKKLVAYHQTKTTIATKNNIWLKQDGKWKLNSSQVPHCIFSILGSGDEVNAGSIRTCLQDILSIARNSKAWIFTSGIDVGIIKHLGQARAKCGWDIPMIGVTTLKKIYRCEIFNWDDRFRIYQPLGVVRTKDHFLLEPNHSSHVLVSSEENSVWGTECQLRRRLETQVARSSLEILNTRVPRICVVFSRDEATLASIADELCQGISVIIVGQQKDAIADELGHALRLYNDGEKDQSYAMLLNCVKQNELRAKKITEGMRLGLLHEYVPCCNGGHRALEDLYVVFRRALMSPIVQQQTNDPDRLQQALRMTLLLNDTETARMVIQGSQSDDNAAYVMSEALVNACIAGNVEMVKLCVLGGARMPISQKISGIRRMIASSESSEDQRCVLLEPLPKEMVLFIRLFVETDWAHLKQQPSWFPIETKTSSKEPKRNMFEKLVKEAGLKLKFPEGEEDLIFCECILQHADNLMNCFLGEGYSGRFGIDGVYERGLDEDAVGFYDLAIWSALANRHELAKFFWENCQPKLPAALILARLYSSMAKENRVNNPAMFQTYSKEFDELASKILKFLDLSFPGAGTEALRAECYAWRDQFCEPKSLLEIAVEGSMTALFTANRAICKETLQLQIQEGLETQQTLLSFLSAPFNSVDVCVIICIFFPFLIPYLHFDKRHLGRLAGARTGSFAWGREVKNFTPTATASKTQDNKSIISPRRKLSTTPVLENRNSIPSFHLKLDKDTKVPPQFSFMNLLLSILSMMYPAALNPKEKFLCFYQSPMTRFYMHCFFYAGFLALFTTENCTPLTTIIPTWPEWVIFAWVLAFTFEEIDQFTQDSAGYFDSVWNLLDVAMLLCYFFGFAIRGFVVPFMMHPHGYGYGFVHENMTNFFVCNNVTELDFNFGVDGSRVAHNSTLAVASNIISNLCPEPMLRSAKVLNSVSCILFWIRALEVTRVDEMLGPLIVAIYKMIIVLLPFMFLFAIVTVGFGAALQGIYNQETDIYRGANEDPDHSLDWISRLYWITFGDGIVDMSNIAPVYGRTIAVYMIVANILLLNLLVAILTTSYTEVKDASEAVWFLEYVGTIQDYRKNKTFAVPLTLFYRLFRIVDKLTSRKSNPIMECWRKLCLVVPAHSQTDDFSRFGCYRAMAQRQDEVFSADSLESDIMIRREQFKVLLDGLFVVADPIVVDAMKFLFYSGRLGGAKIEVSIKRDTLDIEFASPAHLMADDHIQVFLPASFFPFAAETISSMPRDQISIQTFKDSQNNSQTAINNFSATLYVGSDAEIFLDIQLNDSDVITIDRKIRITVKNVVSLPNYLEKVHQETGNTFGIRIKVLSRYITWKEFDTHMNKLNLLFWKQKNKYHVHQHLPWDVFLENLATAYAKVHSSCEYDNRQNILALMDQAALHIIATDLALKVARERQDQELIDGYHLLKQNGPNVETKIENIPEFRRVEPSERPVTASTRNFVRAVSTFLEKKNTTHTQQQLLGTQENSNNNQQHQKRLEEKNAKDNESHKNRVSLSHAHEEDNHDSASFSADSWTNDPSVILDQTDMDWC